MYITIIVIHYKPVVLEEFRIRRFDEFLDLRDHDRESETFKRTAYNLVRNVAVCRDLLDDLDDRLPNNDSLAGRLERSNFTRDRAEKVAVVFRESLSYAGVLVGENRLVRPGEGASREEEEDTDSGATNDNVDEVEQINPPSDCHLRLEIATASGSKVVVLYPSDLTSKDAERVATVLGALSASAG